ncbi:MAG: hypothetical protein SGPRY_007025 [Prymnesium sp.]
MKQAMTNATRKGGIQPTVAGKATARAGRSAGYRSQQMPMCNYGAACTRRDCVYRHPPKGSESMRSDEVCKAFLAGACLYGSKCYCIHPDEDEAERLRQKYAGTPCRWGEECRTQHCLYAHPSDFYDDPTDFYAQPTDHLAQPIDGFAYTTERDAQLIDDFTQPADFDGEGLPDLTALRAWLPLAQDQLCPPCASGTQGREHESQAPVTSWAPASEQAGPQGRSSNWVPNPTAPEWVPCQPAPTSIASVTTAAPWDSQASQYNPTPGSWAAVAIAPPPSDGMQPSQARRREGSHMIHQPEALYSLLPLSFMTLLRPAEQQTEKGVKVSRGGRAEDRFVRAPVELWLVDVARIDAGDAFSIPDPMERFMAVNQPHLRRDQHSPLALVLAHDAMRDRDRLSTAAKVLDMHYQSVRTTPIVLDAVLMAALQKHVEVWIITGTGHHTNQGGHQRTAVGGVLHSTVKAYLEENGYDFYVARDHAGHSGAFLVTA